MVVIRLVCRSCRPSINTICGPVMVGCVVVVVGKYTQCIVILVLWLRLSLLSFVCKHNKWWYYGWVFHYFRPSVNTICGCIMIWFVVVFVHQ